MSYISCPWQPCLICSIFPSLSAFVFAVMPRLRARHSIDLLLSVACNVCATVHKLVSHESCLGQCSLQIMIMGRCSLDHLRYRVASAAAASFQPELACFRRGLVRSDQTFSLSQILPDVKDETR